VKPGDLVVRRDTTSIPKLFIEPYAKWKSVFRKEAGLFSGIGVVVEVLETDVKILSPSGVGWCYYGNVSVV
jgi:hypothetical protein